MMGAALAHEGILHVEPESSYLTGAVGLRDRSNTWERSAETKFGNKEAAFWLTCWLSSPRP